MMTYGRCRVCGAPMHGKITESFEDGKHIVTYRLACTRESEHTP